MPEFTGKVCGGCDKMEMVFHNHIGKQGEPFLFLHEFQGIEDDLNHFGIGE